MAMRMAGFSQRVKVLLAITHTALFWPLWWMVLRYSFLGPIAKSVLKFVFYCNILMMCLYWFECWMAAKAVECRDRDLVKFLLCVVMFLILLEVPWIFSHLS